MIIRRITLCNAGPFLGDWEVRFGEGVNAIVAEYEGAPESSNRGGKSWLAVTAPYYVLHGAVPISGVSVDSIPHTLAKGEEPAWVEMEIETSSGAVHVIRRGRTTGGGPLRLLDGVSISEAELRTAVTTDILGLDADEHEATGMAIQGKLTGFLDMAPAKRRGLVGPWLGVDRWANRRDLAGSHLRLARAELASLDAEIARIGDIEISIKESETRLAEADKNLATARKGVTVADKELTEARRNHGDPTPIQEWIASINRESTALDRERESIRRQRNEEIKRAEEDLARAEGKVAEVRQTLGRVVELRNRKAELVEKINALAGANVEIDSLRGKVEQLRNTVAGASAERDALRAQYERMKDNLTGVCPLLQEPCDRIADRSLLKQIEKRGKEASAIRNAAIDEMKAVQAEVTAAEERDGKLTRWRAELSGLEAQPEPLPASLDIDAASAAVIKAQLHLRDAEKGTASVRKAFTKAGEVEVELAKRLKEAEADLNKVMAGAPHLRAMEAVLEKARVEVDRREVERSKVLAEVATAKERAARLAEAKLERDEAGDLVRHLAWVAFAFGPTGIPAREMESAFGEVADQINVALDTLHAPMRVQLQASRELQSWEPSCVGCGEAFPSGTRSKTCMACGMERRKRREDDFDLRVLDGTRQFAAAQDSGGGRTLLAVATRLGLAQMPGARRRVRCEHLIVDEPDGQLDPPNRRALHHLLGSGALTQFGVRQVILVTHADVRDEFPQTVVVHRWADEERSGCWNA